MPCIFFQLKHNLGKRYNKLSLFYFYKCYKLQNCWLILPYFFPKSTKAYTLFDDRVHKYLIFAAVCVCQIRIQYPSESSKIESLAKVGNSLDTKLFTAFAKSSILDGCWVCEFVSFKMNCLQHKNLIYFRFFQVSAMVWRNLYIRCGLLSIKKMAGLFRNISKQFWCSLYSTKNSILIFIFLFVSDDTFNFSIVSGNTVSKQVLNSDLQKISMEVVVQSRCTKASTRDIFF